MMSLPLILPGNIQVRKQFLLFDDAQMLDLGVRIRHVRNGKYLVKIRSLCEEHGSVQNEWGEMDYLENLSEQDIRYLKDISTPKITITECMIKKTLEMNTVLRPQEIQAIHLIYRME